MHPERAPGRGRDAGLKSKCVATAGALFITPVCNRKTCVRGILFYVLRNFVAQGHRTNCTCRRRHTRVAARICTKTTGQTAQVY